MLRTAIVIAAALAASAASAQVSVDGYYRDNGTYVQPHQRTAPNSSLYDNYSTRGNTNPYTGSQGTREPYSGYSGSSSYGSSGRKRCPNSYC